MAFQRLWHFLIVENFIMAIKPTRAPQPKTNKPLWRNRTDLQKPNTIYQFRICAHNDNFNTVIIKPKQHQQQPQPQRHFTFLCTICYILQMDTFCFGCCCCVVPLFTFIFHYHIFKPHTTAISIKNLLFLSILHTHSLTRTHIHFSRQCK